MIIVGLTGALGSGKTTLVRMLQAEGVPCFEADVCVHGLFQQSSVVNPIKEWVPEAVNQGRIDHYLLSERAFKDAQLLGALEALLHPLVWQACEAFLKECQGQESPLVILDIPLLFEAGYTEICDAIIVLWCAESLLAERALMRPGMSPEKFKAILSRQGSWAEKCRRADYCIKNEGSLSETFGNVKNTLEEIQRRFKNKD